MDLGDYFRFLIALVFVHALIGLLAWLARRAGLGGRVPHRGGDKRIGVTEVSAIDGKRRVVLVRRDDVEHLVLLGPQQDVVIETGIAAPNGNHDPDSPEPKATGGFREQVSAAMTQAPRGQRSSKRSTRKVSGPKQSGAKSGSSSKPVKA